MTLFLPKHWINVTGSGLSIIIFLSFLSFIFIPLSKTLVVNKDNYKELDIPFRTPFIGKVSNKAKYQRISFAGKEKVFLFNSKEE